MDQLSAMRAFVRVVQTGSFSATGREMNTSQTTISKKVAALEKKIGVKLLARSSRDHALTPAGTKYYQTCVDILGELDEAEAEARSEVASPQGTIRISAPVAFGRILLAPIMSEFFQRYPDIKVDLQLSDQHTDLISDGIDVAIRAKQLEDSTLIARHLFDNPMLVLAAPNYLQQHGEPKTPEDLKQHNCLVYSRMKDINVWSFTKQNQKHAVAVNGNFQSDNGDVLLEVALTGMGIVTLPIWMVEHHLKEGRLTQLMSDYTGQNLPFNAVYLQSRYTPLKVRCLIDYLKEKLPNVE
ncbi:Bacterial regulatory helix-turn-helix protein [Vibrio sp. B1ASS3]|uniref:LysR family transcriptional regulator n=1 Tax=Vibrio sp. B1ASS3 TaxID=2751176 RepID=UPI001ABB7847|nr:LysR family transcriptional regulator [Vibrio sp. B1ASS3]CAD7828043.1 Bacterial regulatory helix-turn-helix protein [Vibrio sp. B1ASS3]CAE6967608.1 Bacterial regulatory helix-turn-helix protein [Vibrio sp. B1ASS3]HDM8223471.1 LysR family transcriptional regulator [Vibrio campbellii]HDM8245037.1 LysR family transcriptional regulator [Vibrio campbellii]